MSAGAAHDGNVGGLGTKSGSSNDNAWDAYKFTNVAGLCEDKKVSL